PADLRRAGAQRSLPGEPAAAPRRRPRQVPPRDRGGAPAAVRGRPRGHVPVPRRGRDVRRRRVPGVDGDGRRRGRGAQAAARGRRRGDARTMSRSLAILEPGIQATVQDYPGRRGMQAQGFFPAGPMDHLAHRAANLLVGNDESAATLEITLGNFRLRLDGDATLAVCGAEAPLTLDGEQIAAWESHRVTRGSELAVGLASGPGFRAYVAVDGGFDVPP